MRIILVAVLACAVQSATAAEIPIPVAPAPVFVAPDPYPSRFLQQGVFFELGARYWFSSGNFSRDLFGFQGDGRVSRLSYSGLTNNAGEFFGSVKQVNGYFLKWNVGAGNTFAGKLVDEDWNLPPNISPFPFSSTTSSQRDGGIGYATIDLGYNVFSSHTWQVGPFVGINFLRETMTATGCAQQILAQPICSQNQLPLNQPAITQRADWTSIRVGGNADWNVTNQFKLSANAAWLYTKFDGQDSHLLTLGRSSERGIGSGVQLEGIASYAFSDSFSIGVGGRYWFLQANGQEDFSSQPQGGLQPLSIKAQRFGVFLQGTYTFGLPDIGRRSPWLSCC